MISPRARRDRGRILTDKGLKKLREAINNEFPGRYTLPEISAMTDPGFNPKVSSVSDPTVSKILNRREGADRSKIESLFTAFELTLNDDDHISAADFVGEGEGAIENTRHDWGEAPDVRVFYGRTEELTQLEEWIVKDRCRLVALWGMAGIGKRFLSVKLAKQIANDFEYIIWRSLGNAPLIQDILADLIEFFCEQQKADLPVTISRLIECLQAHRCLVILDEVEMILERSYPEGYQDYQRLFRQVGESQHQSCLMLTSSEKPRQVALLEGKTSPVRSYKVNGLKPDAAKQILTEKALVEEEEWNSLIERYEGNPFALKIVCATILDVFDGKASKFLKRNTIFIEPIKEVLDRQFERLEDLEINVICKLATTHDPVNLDQLLEVISLPVSNSQLMEALKSLLWRSLIYRPIESDKDIFTLQPVVRKYVIERFSLTQSRLQQR
jgi:hypothetical protein